MRDLRQRPPTVGWVVAAGWCLLSASGRVAGGRCCHSVGGQCVGVGRGGRAVMSREICTRLFMTWRLIFASNISLLNWISIMFFCSVITEKLPPPPAPPICLLPRQAKVYCDWQCVRVCVSCTCVPQQHCWDLLDATHFVMCYVSNFVMCYVSNFVMCYVSNFVWW